MNRIVLFGVLALTAGVPGLMAQQAAPAQPVPAKPAQPVQRQPAPKSKGELEALQAIFKQQPVDDRIKACEALLTKYADTDFKDLANYMIASGYQQKGDAEKQIIYLRRTLDANPKHYQAMIDLAEVLAQRTKEFDFDREDKLNQVDKYANNAINVLKDAPKPNPNFPDEQWDRAKKDLVARAHQALGLAAMVRKKNDVAIAEFKTAIESSATPEPAFQVRLAQVYVLDGKYDEAIALCDQIGANEKAHPQVKQVAQSIRTAAAQAKASGVKPAQGPKPGEAVKVEVRNP